VLRAGIDCSPRDDAMGPCTVRRCPAAFLYRARRCDRQEPVAHPLELMAHTAARAPTVQLLTTILWGSAVISQDTCEQLPCSMLFALPAVINAASAARPTPHNPVLRSNTPAAECDKPDFAE
jgi:hypothetical protein